MVRKPVVSRPVANPSVPSLTKLGVCVHPPLRVVLPDEARARSLRAALEPFGVEIEPVDGHYEVSVELIDRNPDGRLVSALSAIDRWLIAEDLPFVQVDLDGAVYTISSSVGAPESERAAPEEAGINPGVE